MVDLSIISTSSNEIQKAVVYGKQNTIYTSNTHTFNHILQNVTSDSFARD